MMPEDNGVMIITADILREVSACPEQIALFEDTFGQAGAAWTPENLARARSVGLNIRWVSRTLRLPLDLHGVNLSLANLAPANLSDATLYAVDLSDADLTGVDLL